MKVKQQRVVRAEGAESRGGDCARTEGEAQLFGYFEGSVGNDASVGAGISFIYFENNKTWKSDYMENYTTGELGVLGVSVNHSMNYNRELRVHGDLVRSAGIGISVGSDQIPFLGAVNVRASHGYTYRINMPWQK